MNQRTDLATEAGELHQLGEQDGFIEQVSVGDIPVSRIRIVNQKAADVTGKPIGNYATVFFDGAFSDDEKFDKAIEATANVLREFLKGAPSVLAVGLGNAEMTADALGPKIIDRLIVSRHLKEHLPDLYRELALGEVSALRPGGTVEIDGKRVNAASGGELIRKGERVLVTGAEGDHVTVRPV